MQLAFIDEHRRPVAAEPEAIYDAVTEVVAGAFSGRLASSYGRLIGCRPHGPIEPGPLRVGSALIGAAVVRAEPSRRLILEGRHHFAEYRLDFAIVETEAGPVVIARTDAAFPGVRGRLYRAAVIGSRAHALVVRRLLAAIAERATG